MFRSDVMEKQTVTATVFIPPRGQRKEIEISKVLPDDAAYINSKGIKVSLEELMTGDTVIYFDDGTTVSEEDDDTPDEIIIISHGGQKSCEDCFNEGVALLKKREAHPSRDRVDTTKEEFLYED